MSTQIPPPLRHSQIGTDECNPIRQAIGIRAMALKTGTKLKPKYLRLNQMEFRTRRLEKADLGGASEKPVMHDRQIHIGRFP